MQYQMIPVTPFQQNCTLVWCEQSQQAAVIDPGGDLERINNALQEKNLKLEKVLLTHGHIDHVGGAKALAEQHQVPIEGPHKGDQFWLDGLAQQSAMFGFAAVAPFAPDRWLSEGDKVCVGQNALQVLHCPGHTPGHIVFFDPDTRTAQVGDVLFKGSIGRTDFPQGDHQQLLAAITQKLFPLGDDVCVIPGHGPATTIGEERRSNPFVADQRG